MAIWAYVSGWNCPRRMDADEETIARYAEVEENRNVILFFGELVMPDFP
jgi:hypothetical protein